tara:strand:- start:1693 stop:2550 length:858 start_codon:yes stop_codon:yes gene_type:complete
MKKIYFLLILFSLSAESKNENSFVFQFKSFEIPVFFTAPAKISNKTRIVVVMHGRKRNAEEYRNQWIEKAKELNLLIIVPQFSEKDFPGVYSYNYGNIFTENKKPLKEDEHLFSLIEPLVNFSVAKFKLRSNTWGIYGHGAGAHFVHRYVLHEPEANHTLAIAANLGWYLSMTDQEWPFGLKNSTIDDQKLQRAFKKYFLLMLGRADTSTKPHTQYVAENWDKITLQGKHRLDRGRKFFREAVIKSKSVNEFFKWGMVEVPTTMGHSNTEQMVPYAAEMFYERLK